MAEKDRPSRSRASATPEDYATTASSSVPPGADYKLTVDLVGSLQHELGKLTEAVNSLKEQSRDHGLELKTISRDIHTAKTTVKIVGGILAALLAFSGWAINKAVD